MKTFIIIILCINCICVFSQNSRKGFIVNLPNSQTLFSVKDSSHVNCVNLLAHKKITIIAFWLSSCPPCIRELNAFNKKLTEWQKKYNFEFFAISNDKIANRAKAINLWKTNNWKFNILFDEKNILRNTLLGDCQGVPQLIIINENNKIILHKFGFRPNDETLIPQYLTK
jgi:cytochrome c biogenesis protein CcmG, thiol:disulfide interchange protein DsbE